MRKKNIIAFLAAFMTAAVMTAPVSADKYYPHKFVDEIDTSGIVQLYRSDNTFMCESGDNVNGFIYADISSFASIDTNLVMAKFEDGKLVSRYTGFTKNKNGRRYYENGSRVLGWHKINGSWYHFDIYSGYMDTGKTVIGGAVYYLNSNGKWEGKLSKSGIAPSDFQLSYMTYSLYGFSTADKKLIYGENEDGKAECTAAFSQRDIQYVYGMRL